jgi:hypothetical protein
MRDAKTEKLFFLRSFGVALKLSKLRNFDLKLSCVYLLEPKLTVFICDSLSYLKLLPKKVLREIVK